MPKRKPEYRLQLQNRWTDNVDELVAECDKIRDAMEELGLVVIGYDPGIVARNASDPGGHSSVEIPTWFLKRLMEYTTVANKLAEGLELVLDEHVGDGIQVKQRIDGEIERGAQYYLRRFRELGKIAGK